MLTREHIQVNPSLASALDPPAANITGR